ncbi:MAG: hypothetical protein QOJ84_3777 [Bradyrhizobium sp.]|nr:hypothetical protein [Bradyrhizobium sp.]
MKEFANRFMSRLPRSWAARAVWLMLGVAAFWVAYRFGSNYMNCRQHGEKVSCVVNAFSATAIQVFTHVIDTAIRLATFILP